MIQPVSSGIEQGGRDTKGRFIKGVSGNPKGPNAGYRLTAYKQIDEAIHEFQEQNGMSYWKAATLIAMKLAKENGNVTLLCKIMDKFIPSKSELIIDDQEMTTLPFTVKLNGIESRN